METRTRSGGKRSMVVVESGDEPYFKTKEEIDVYAHKQTFNAYLLKLVFKHLVLYYVCFF
jgi:hypothetical protein